MKKKGMMLSMNAGPFFFGLLIGIVVGAFLVRWMLSRGILSGFFLPG